jgi:hypothetical protein
MWQHNASGMSRTWGCGAFLAGIRLLIPAGEPLPCKVRHVREREECGKRDKSPRMHESQVSHRHPRNCSLFLLYRAQISRIPMINLFVSGKGMFGHTNNIIGTDLPHDSWDKLLLPVRGMPRGPDLLRRLLFLAGHYFAMLMFHSPCPLHCRARADIWTLQLPTIWMTLCKRILD